MCRGTTGGKRVTGKPRRRACSWEQRLLHVLRRCRPSPTFLATNRSGPCRLTAVVVAVGEGRALSPLRCYPRGNRGLGLDEKQKNKYKTKGIG